MRTLFITQQWEPEVGIPQRRGLWMASAMSADHCKVDVVTAPPHYPHGDLIATDSTEQPNHMAEASYGRVFRSHFRKHSQSIASRIIDQAIIALSSARIARKVSKADRPGVIIASTPPLPSMLVATYVGKLRGVPYVLDIRDAWPELTDYIAQSSDDGQSKPPLTTRILAQTLRLTKPIFRSSIRNAAALIATNATHASYLEQTYRLPVLTLPNSILYSGENSTTFPVGHRPTGSLRILYAGTVGRAQGLHNAVCAARLAQDEGIDITVRIIGTGARLDSLKKLAHSLNAPIEFFDYLPRKEIIPHLRWSDVVLVHLENWEPLKLSIPSKLYPAISSGRFVTAVVSGTSAEAIRRSRAGAVIPPGDPHALAQHWVSLAQDRSQLSVNSAGAEWMRQQHEEHAYRQEFTAFIRRIAKEHV